MIRCTIELLPGGNEARKRTIGLIEIANLSVDVNNYGTYAVVLKKTPPFNGALKAAWRTGRLAGSEIITEAIPGEDDEAVVVRISGHHRTRRGVYDLLYRALSACGLESR